MSFGDRRTPLRSDPKKAQEWQRRSARKYANKRRRSSEQATAYQENREKAARMVDGRCMAEGFHHETCRGMASVTHHILPRENGGEDHFTNLLPVWGGISGADGCHGKIHREREEAKRLGYLR